MQSKANSLLISKSMMFLFYIIANFPSTSRDMAMESVKVFKSPYCYQTCW